MQRHILRTIELLLPLPVAMLFTACGDTPTSPPPAALTVAVSFLGGSACTPLPRKPCAVTVTADTGGSSDGLRYTWSGCATGSARSATCVVERPGAVTALGGGRERSRADRSRVGVGARREQPAVRLIGYITRTPNSDEIGLLGAVTDPEEGMLNEMKHCESVTATGACRPWGFMSCGGLAGLEVYVFRTATTGACTVTITVKDSWDERGTSVFAFDVAR
jgi:hypothetical protein